MDSGADDSEGPSVEHIQTSELFPCCSLRSDDPTLQVPYPVLCGEAVEFLGRTADGVITLSNYRLFIRSFADNSCVNMPIKLVEYVDVRDLCQLLIYCKDARTIRCSFEERYREDCMEWHRRLSLAINPMQKIEDCFAFAFYAWCMDQVEPTSLPFSQDGGYDFFKEIERMGFRLGEVWRICELNTNYKFCPTYPKYHLVPVWITDQELEKVAQFRAMKRIPSVVWRHQVTGAVIARCSQPEVGWLGWRNTQDEDLLKAVARACAMDSPPDGAGYPQHPIGNGSISNGHLANGDVGKTVEDKMKTVLVLDARSYTAAVANRAKGGGCECAEYYPNCDIQFMGLANIHAIRKSFQAMRQLCASPSDQASWLSALENTRWLHNISALIKSALLVVDAVDRKGQPVIVHCSDGWDRTPQIVALGELMMDSFYRTIEGFQVLVEREWLEFGHKFGDRCGHNLNTDDANERCPVFLQFLDCVHQLQLQFPCAFEFNEAYLVKLIQHTYSCLFGTFLCNSSKARHHHRIHKRTFSTWTFLRSTRKRFCNLLYAHSDQVLKPVSSIQKLEFWATVYLADHASGTPDDRAAAAAAAAAETTLPPTMATLLLTKTRSCDDIVAVLEQQQQQHALTRTSSDPNLAEMHRGFLPSGGAPSSAAATTMPDPSAGTALNNGCGGGLENGCGRQECVPAASCVDEAEMTNGAVTMYENHVNDGEGDRDATNESVEEREDVEQQEEEEEEEGEEGREKAEKNCIAFNTKSRSERVEPWNGRPSAVEQSVESSTDTLVQDPTTLAVTADSDTYVSPACCSNGVTSSATFDSPPCCANGVAANDVVVVKSFDEKFKRSSLGLTVNTDCGGGGGSAAPAARDGQPTTQQAARPCRTAHASGSSVTSAESSPNQWTTATLAAATTPGSSYPTSPVMVALDPLLHRSMSGLLRQLDHDGLPVVRDPVQQQLRRQQAEYMARIDALQRELHETQNLLIRQMCRQCCQYATNAVDYYDESGSLPESTESGVEQQSLGGRSGTSDLSWEHVEGRDADMTLWMPDHAAARCLGCEAGFSVVRRKHHCRNCGKIFCDECTNYRMALPSEQLPYPVRVCYSCFRTVQSSQSLMDVALDKSIAVSSS